MPKSNLFLTTLRKNHQYTQEQIAEIIGVTRQTYASIEAGNSELNLSQASKLADLYGISIDNLSKQNDTTPQVTLTTAAISEKSQVPRINIPQSNIALFKEVLLYILNKVGARRNVGMTVIYKLLYFIDFDYYEKFEKQFLGLEYIKNHYGPTPIAFAKVIQNMIEAEELVQVKNKYFNKEQVKFLPLRNSKRDILSDEQFAHIDDVLRRLADKNANELSELSHKDTPWLAAKPSELLDYEAVFYRTAETSVRSYGDGV